MIREPGRNSSLLQLFAHGLFRTTEKVLCDPIVRVERESRSFMAAIENRRHFLTTGLSITGAICLGGAAGVMAGGLSLATEGPPETTAVRLAKYPATCVAPLFIVDDLLREEGFADVRYVSNLGTFYAEMREVDFDLNFSGPAIIPIDAGEPATILAGVHPGCVELFAREGIRKVLDLKGKSVGTGGMGSTEYILLSIIAANVGLDPARDIYWLMDETRDAGELFANGKIDAFLAIPPKAQELHARHVGHVILNSTLDHPWSQYFCCMLVGNTEFVRRNPIATKRVVRAMLRATDICASKPDWVARRLVDRGFTPKYDYAQQGLAEIPYRKWRDYDSEDTIRFYALRLHELGMIKANPEKIIANGTNWRFLNEVKQEMGI
jgi:NitT/TauT family transport system substrate-binding protein